ncbi:hypothetical protein EBR43_07790, partial [bacterium]|nr:hypothetical protein [bacterium]
MRTLKHSVDYLNLFSKEIDQVTSPIQLLNDLLHKGIDGVSLPALLKSINDENNEQLLNEFLRQLNNQLPEGQKIEVSANKEAINGAVESYVHEQIRTRLNSLVAEKLFNPLKNTPEPEDVLFLQLVTSPNNRLGNLINPDLITIATQHLPTLTKKDFDSTIIPASISDPLLNSLLLNQGSTPIDKDQVSITHTIEYMAASWMEKDSTAIATQSDDPFLSFVDTNPEIVKYLPEQTQKKLKEIKKSSEIGKIEETKEKESNNNYDVAQLLSSWWSGGSSAAYSSPTIAPNPKSKDKPKNHSSSTGSLKKVVVGLGVGLLLWGFNSYSSLYPSAKVVMRDKPQLLSTANSFANMLRSNSDSPKPQLQAVAFADSGSRLFQPAPFYHTIQKYKPYFGIAPYQFKSLAYPLYSVPSVFPANPPLGKSVTKTTSTKPY